MRRKITLIAITAVLLAAIVSQIAVAAGQSYIDKRRVINVGVLVMGHMSMGSWAPVFPPSPGVFYIMDQRDDLKPYGWSFENPLAPGNANGKSLSSYWQVSLAQTTSANLTKFDLLYMNANQLVELRTSDRDKLRRYVDQGGCLWIDNDGGMTFPNTIGGGSDPAYSFFLPDVNFQGAAGGNLSVLAKLHPLLTNPCWLSPQEIQYLGDVSYSINPGFVLGGSPTTPSPTILAPIVTQGNEPTIAAIEYGSGRIVFTSQIGSRIVGSGNPFLAPQAALRFGYNVISWASSYTTEKKNYRRNAASLEGLGAPLELKWNIVDHSPAAGTNMSTSPAIWKNVIYYTSGSTLYALDAVPNEDLDGDGNPNDGLQNTAGDGFPQYDVIWSVELPGGLSSPTVASMIVPTTTGSTASFDHKDVVLVSNKAGDVFTYEALPVDPTTGRLSATPNDLSLCHFTLTPTPPSTPLNSTAFPVVAQNGWIYSLSDDGIVRGYCPALGATTPPLSPAEWLCGLNPTPGFRAKYGPVFGFVKDKTGALVQTLCVVGTPPTPVGAPSDPNDYLCFVPVSVASDTLKAPSTLGNSWASGTYMTSFLSSHVSSYPAPVAWAVDPNGDSIPVTATVPTGAFGQVQISTKSGASTLSPSVKVFMTYSIDYTGPVTTPPYFEIQPRSTLAGFESRISSCPSLSPDDIFYYGITWPSVTGGLNVGRSAVQASQIDKLSGGNPARVKWSYFLHGGGNAVVPDAFNSPGVLGSGVPLDQLDPSRLWGINTKDSTGAIVPVQNLEVTTTPVVSGDKLFVTASTTKPGSANISCGYLLCFKANPEFVIRLNRSLRSKDGNGRNMSVKIWQPDLLLDPLASGVSAPINSGCPIASADMIDYDTGTITITDFSTVRVHGGTVPTATNIITPSLPVWVFLDNQPVPLNEVDLSGWDNLLWALAIPDHGAAHCSGIHSSPIVMGDYVYFTCDDGYLFAVSTDATTNSNNVKILDPKDTVIPMRHPISTAAGGGSTVSGKTPVSLAGGTGNLAVPTDNGLYVFSNSLTLVTDNRRVMEIGGDGKLAWACDSVYESKEGDDRGGSTAAAAYDSSPLNKPMVAQKYGPTDYFVVDSGNNRILRMDRSGMVTWKLTNFEDPNNLLRPGESHGLKSPADAKMWSEYVTTGGTTYYILHCLVADTGNFRVLDIVDRYTVTGGKLVPTVLDASKVRPIHELNWVSQTTNMDKKFLFNSVQVVGGTQIWAAVSNYGLTDNNVALGGGQLGGAVVAMNYRTLVAPQGGTRDYPSWTYLPGVVTPQITKLVDESLSGPRSITVTSVSTTDIQMLICDSGSVYLVNHSIGSGVNTVTWKLNASQYAGLTRTVLVQGSGSTTDTRIKIPFSPTRAQLLPNGKVLIVNGYAGPTYSSDMGKFVGEVFEVDMLTASPNSISWYTPNIWQEPAPSKVLYQQMPNGQIPSQPTSVQRLM